MIIHAYYIQFQYSYPILHTGPWILFNCRHQSKVYIRPPCRSSPLTMLDRFGLFSLQSTIDCGVLTLVRLNITVLQLTSFQSFTVSPFSSRDILNLQDNSTKQRNKFGYWIHWFNRVTLCWIFYHPHLWWQLLTWQYTVRFEPMRNRGAGSTVRWPSSLKRRQPAGSSGRPVQKTHRRYSVEQGGAVMWRKSDGTYVGDVMWNKLSQNLLSSQFYGKFPLFSLQ